MNRQLQDIFSMFYNSNTAWKDNNSSGSSQECTKNLCSQLSGLFVKHNIKSMFDAGCNDGDWQNLWLDFVEYQGGDISPSVVARANKNFQKLKISLFDITSEIPPYADVLFLRHVTIHLSNQHKTSTIKNWLDSNIPWLLITHTNKNLIKNQDIEYGVPKLPFAETNWNLEPWNFPNSIDKIDDKYSVMALWHRSQFDKGIT
jgi:hypothetical protein